MSSNHNVFPKTWSQTDAWVTIWRIKIYNRCMKNTRCCIYPSLPYFLPFFFKYWWLNPRPSLDYIHRYIQFLRQDLTELLRVSSELWSSLPRLTEYWDYRRVLLSSMNIFIFSCEMLSEIIYVRCMALEQLFSFLLSVLRASFIHFLIWGTVITAWLWFECVPKDSCVESLILSVMKLEACAFRKCGLIGGL